MNTPEQNPKQPPETGPEQTAPSPPAQTATPQAAEPAKASGGSALKIVMLLLVMGGVLTLVGIGAVAAYWLYQSSSEDETTTETGEDEMDGGSQEDSTETETDIDTSEIIDDEDADDTEAWLTYENEDLELSFEYPADWEVTDECDDLGLTTSCGISVSDGEYLWILDIDPFVTGGGFGYLFDMVVDASTTVSDTLYPGGYEAVIVTQYVDAEELADMLTDADLPEEGEIWNWSVAFSDPDDPFSPGFGEGEMYDEIDNNFWGIFYRYQPALEMDYDDLPMYGSEDLEEALNTMHQITESLGLS